MSVDQSDVSSYFVVAKVWTNEAPDSGHLGAVGVCASGNCPIKMPDKEMKGKGAAQINPTATHGLSLSLSEGRRPSGLMLPPSVAAGARLAGSRPNRVDFV